MSSAKNNRQKSTVRSKDWRGDAIFGASGEHRQQTRYKQRSIRTAYRREIKTELSNYKERLHNNDD